MANVQNMKLIQTRNQIERRCWQMQVRWNLVGTYIKGEFWPTPALSINISGYFLMHHSNLFGLEKAVLMQLSV